MYRLTLLGAAGLAASLMAVPAFAATDATSAKPPPPAATATATPPAATATATTTTTPAAPAGSEMYATVGQGGYTADQDYITNGAKHVNNANDANMRPSQRNAALADNGSARASKVIGTTVYNTNNQKLGSVDDILIGKSGLFAVISTNQKKVGVPFDKLEFGDARNAGDNKLVLPNETQARLNTEPEIHYNEANYQAWQASHKNTENTAHGIAGNTVTGVRPGVPMVNGHTNTHS